MFHTHRSGNAFEYIFDHKEYANGHNYYVTVGVTEGFERFCHEGARLFNIFVNEQPFAKKLDVYKESGGCKHVLVMTKQMTPDDGIFEVSFEGLDNHRAMVAFIEIKAVEPNEC